MKTNLFIIFVLLANVVSAQYQNLNKMPQKQRDSLLVKIANEAIDKYSTGYLRPGNKPHIEEIWNGNAYVVRYEPTQKEKEAYSNQNYLVKAIILANIGRVREIRYIDDDDRYMTDMETIDPNEKVTYRRKFKTAEERLEEIKRHHTFKVDTVPPSEKMRKFLEMKQRRRDSGQILRQQYLRRRDSIRQQDSIRMIRQQDSIKNEKTKKE